MLNTGWRAAIVTGGARRIGRAIVEDLVAEGWAVAIHCNRSKAEAETLAADLSGRGARVGVVVADLSDLAAVAGLMRQAEDLVGPISLLVNNASEFEPDSAIALDPVRFERHMRVNLVAPCTLASDLAARLPEGRDGVVVNLVDQRVWRLTPSFFSYTLSKSALWTATQTMAQGLAPRVRVAAIGPGPTLANQRQRPEDFTEQTDALLLRRGPALAEITAAVRFIVDTPSFTGQMLALDGGQHLAWQTPDALVAE